MAAGPQYLVDTGTKRLKVAKVQQKKNPHQLNRIKKKKTVKNTTQ